MVAERRIRSAILAPYYHKLLTSAILFRAKNFVTEWNCKFALQTNSRYVSMTQKPQTIGIENFKVPYPLLYRLKKWVFSLMGIGVASSRIAGKLWGTDKGSSINSAAATDQV